MWPFHALTLSQKKRGLNHSKHWFHKQSHLEVEKPKQSQFFVKIFEVVPNKFLRLSGQSGDGLS